MLVPSLTLLLMVNTAFAQTATPISCGRLPPAEKAQCLVRQRNEVLRQLGRLPGSSSSSVAPAAPVSSAPQPRSCSRLSGKEKGACLVEQRKEILKLLSSKAPVTVARPATAVKPSCVRYRDPLQRSACLGGGSVSSSSSSAQ